MQYIQNNGIALETNYQYKAKDQACNRNVIDNDDFERFTIKDFEQIKSRDLVSFIEALDK